MVEPSFSLCQIDQAMLPAFLPYLMPEAAQAIAAGEDDIVALGVVTSQGHSCAALAADLIDNQAVVFSLFVDPTVRRLGIATMLLEGLTEAAEHPETTQVEWVLPHGEFEELVAFLTTRGFTCAEPQEPVYRLNSDELRHTPILRRAFAPGFRPDGNIVPYSRLTPKQREELLADRDIPYWLRPDKFPQEEMMDNMSLCYIYGERVTAYLLMAESGSDECAILASYTRSHAHPAAFLQLVSAALFYGINHFGGTFFCWLDATDPRTETLARQMTGDRLEPWWTGTATK